ncbi:MAG: hypothetical protein M3N98_03505, partial [Actinomycetota bacterium]|nr:hypothetical protein [Actinomycetota bacterium]
IRVERAYRDYLARAEQRLAAARAEAAAEVNACRDQALRLAERVAQLEAEVEALRSGGPERG